MTATKDPAELAWERHAPEGQRRRLMITPRNQHERDRRIDDEAEREYFKAGYHAAMAQQEQAIRKGRESALRELKLLAETYKWISSNQVSKEASWGRAYERAMRELLGKYSDTTEVEPHDP